MIRKSRFHWFTVVLFVGLLMIIGVACGSNSGATGDDAVNNNTNEPSDTNDTETPKEFNFGAATQGGFWYTFAAAISEEMNKTFPGSSTAIIEGGSISNLIGLDNDQFDLAFVTGQDIPHALNGEGPFEKKLENISWMATLYPSVFQIVVREDSDIQTVDDLKGKRVSPGIKGYGAELTFQELLKINDMSYDDLAEVQYVGLADAGDLLRDGHIDAIIGIVDAPVSTFQELDSTLGIRLIEIPQDVLEELQILNGGYKPFTIVSETYSNIKEDTETFAVHVSLLVNNDLDNETVYELTKLINENTDKWKTLSKTLEPFDSFFSISNRLGPMHPGAEEYYKEAGALN